MQAGSKRLVGWARLIDLTLEPESSKHKEHLERQGSAPHSAAEPALRQCVRFAYKYVYNCKRLQIYSCSCPVPKKMVMKI